MSAAFSSWTKKQPKLQLKVLTGVLEISRFPTYKMYVGKSRYLVNDWS